MEVLAIQPGYIRTEPGVSWYRSGPAFDGRMIKVDFSVETTSESSLKANSHIFLLQ
jgi:hypothetical protein